MDFFKTEEEKKVPVPGDSETTLGLVDNASAPDTLVSEEKKPISSTEKDEETEEPTPSTATTELIGESTVTPKESPILSLFNKSETNKNGTKKRKRSASSSPNQSKSSTSRKSKDNKEITRLTLKKISRIETELRHLTKKVTDMHKRMPRCNIR